MTFSLRPLRGLFFASHPEPTCAVTAMAVALAASSGHTLSGVLLIGLAVLIGQLSVGWHNDWLDAARDHDSGRPDKPAANGSVSTGAIKWAAGIAGVLTIPVSLSSGWIAGSAHIVAVSLAWTYNAWFKPTVFSFLPYALAFPLLVGFVTLSLPLPVFPPWWALAAAALLGTGAHLANTVPDLEDDARSGMRGLPHRLGRRVSVVVASVLLCSATALLTVAAPRSGLFSWICLAVVAIVLALGLRFGNRPHSRLLFRVTMIIALIDVVLLVLEGRSFSA